MVERRWTSSSRAAASSTVRAPSRTRRTSRCSSAAATSWTSDPAPTCRCRVPYARLISTARACSRLWDMHVHLGSRVPPWERGAREESEASYACAACVKLRTTCGPGSRRCGRPSDRFDADLQLKAAINAGTLDGPRIFASGDSSWSRGAAGEDEYPRRARALLWRGADHIKLFASGAIAVPVSRSIGHLICAPGGAARGDRGGPSLGQPGAGPCDRRRGGGRRRRCGRGLDRARVHPRRRGHRGDGAQRLPLFTTAR